MNKILFVFLLSFSLSVIIPSYAQSEEVEIVTETDYSWLISVIIAIIAIILWIIFRSRLLAWWGGDDEKKKQPSGPKKGEKCKVPQITKTQEYSRGNNNSDQIKAQHAATGKYQYETTRFFLDISTTANCICAEGGKCTGTIDIDATLKIKLITQVHNLATWVLLCGPFSTKITEEYNDGNKPRPDIKISVDNAALPAAKAKNKFSNTPAKPQEWTAKATCNISCDVGKYLRRFYLVKDSAAGTTVDLSSGLLFFIDCVVEVTKIKSCELGLSLKAYLLEYRPGYDFTAGDPTLAPGLKELPEITHTHPTGGTSTKTRSITKLIKEDGTTVDTPFPPRHPSVP